VNPRRTLAVSRRVLRGIRHDRRSIGLILFAPIMAMFVFGIAFSGDVSDVPVAVINFDTGYTLPNGTFRDMGASILAHLDTHLMRVILLDPASQTAQGAAAYVERGEARAALIIPPRFTQDAFHALANASFVGNTSIELRLDRSNVNIAADIERAVAEALFRAVEEFGRPAPVRLDDSHPVYGAGASFADFLIPGVMTFAVFILTSLLTITSFVQERTSGTLDRLGASPLTEGEMVLGYSLAYSLVAVVQAAVLITVAIVVFHIAIVGSLALAFVFIALLAIASQGLGILLSAAARTEAQAIQFVPFLILPIFLLSGIFWPVEAIPAWLRPLSWALPTTYEVEGLRSVMIRGLGIDRVGPYLAALALFGLLFFAAARLSLKRSRK
jgi:ABC-2 type transport system permease protein